MSDKRGPCRGGRAPELLLVSMFYSACGMENLEAESEHKTQVPRTSAHGPMDASSLKGSWSLNLSALCGGSASCKEVPGAGQSSPAPASPSLPSPPPRFPSQREPLLNLTCSGSCLRIPDRISRGSWAKLAQRFSSTRSPLYTRWTFSCMWYPPAWWWVIC